MIDLQIVDIYGTLSYFVNFHWQYVCLSVFHLIVPVWVQAFQIKFAHTIPDETRC